MNDLYVSASAAYLVILTANLFLSIGILLRMDPEQDSFKDRMIRVLAIGVALFSFSQVITSSSTLLKDVDIINGWEQNKFYMIARLFGIAASCVFFSTLSLGFPYKKKIGIAMFAICTGIVIYFFKIFM